jgi:hypothetical protein
VRVTAKDVEEVLERETTLDDREPTDAQPAANISSTLRINRKRWIVGLTLQTTEAPIRGPLWRIHAFLVFFLPAAEF